MAGLCIPRSIVEKVRTAIKSGDINLEKLYEMTPDEAHKLFSNFVGDANATLVNAVYEKAKIDATKKAAADYVTNEAVASGKTGAQGRADFTKTATAGEFGKKLLSPDKTKEIAVGKIDEQIKSNQAKQKTLSYEIAKAEGDARSNLQFKLNKLQEQVARLNVRKEDIKNPPTDALLKKIQNNKGLLTDSDYQDLASTKLGQELTPAQNKYIVDQATKLQDLAKANKDSLLGVTNEYVQARTALNSYLESIKPVSAAGSIIKDLAITGRNFKLTNPSTPTKTLVGQLVSGLTEKIALRMSTLSTTGAARDLIAPAYKEAQAIFAKNRIDITTQMGALGEGHGFDVPAGVKSSNPIVRTIQKGAELAAKVTTKVAIDWEHSIVMTKFHQRAFFDAANILASKWAKSPAEARALFSDAIKLTPETEGGTALKLAAQNHAARVVGFNNTWASKLTVGVRDTLNGYLDGLGTLAAPIVKIPATLIANGIENSGVGIATVFKDVFQGWRKTQSEDLGVRYEGLAQYGNGLKTMSRTLGVLGVAAYITSQLNPSDFKTDRYGGTYVRIGGVWVNQEYFNVIGPAISGMMDVKKAGNKSLATKTGAYISGAAQGLRNLPVFNEANTIITDLTTGQGKQIVPYLKTFGTGFIEPAIVKHAIVFLKTLNPKELFFSTSGLPDQTELRKLGAK